MAHNSIINLAEFDQDILRPTLTGFVEANTRQAEAYAFAGMVSVYFWIVLGVEAGYFPADHAQSLFAQRFSEFFGRFDALFKKWGNISDPEFEPLLFSAISHRRLSQREEHRRITSHPVVAGALRSALLAESLLLRDREGNAFAAALSFSPDLVDSAIGTIGASGGAPGSRPDPDEVARGFQSIWTYMETLTELSALLREEEEQAIGKKLDARLRQLTRWRVNRHTPGVDPCLTRVAVFVNRRYCKGILEEAEVERRVWSVLDRWGYTHFRTFIAEAH